MLVEPFDFDYDYDFSEHGKRCHFLVFQIHIAAARHQPSNGFPVLLLGTRLWPGTLLPDWSGIRKNNVKPFSSRSPSKVFPTLESCIAARHHFLKKADLQNNHALH